MRPDRWAELERLGQLRRDDLLTEEEFQREKIRIILSHEEHHVVDPETGQKYFTRPRMVVAGGVLTGIAAILVWAFSSVEPSNISNLSQENKSISNVSLPAIQQSSYALRSNVRGASLVRLSNLPTVSPYTMDADDYCSDRLIRPETVGGKYAVERGWQVKQEERFENFDAVLVVRRLEAMTSGRCSAEDANVAFFENGKIVGVLYGKGKESVSISSIEMVDHHLRIWSPEPIAEGQVTLNGNILTFDRISGSDAVCSGKYRVPAVFGKPYSEARRILASSGWLPVPSTEEVSEIDRTTEYRKRFPEANACAGTGYAECDFGFSAASGNARLQLTTIGEADDPDVSTYGVTCEKS